MTDSKLEAHPASARSVTRSDWQTGTLAIKMMPISDLKPNPHNARTHSKHQIRQIAESIRFFGFTNPVLTDAEGHIMAGHGRLEAGKLLGMKEVPTIRLDRLTQEQIRAYVIADNKLAENAGWDKESADDRTRVPAVDRKP